MKSLKELIKFGMVGILNTIVSNVVYILVVNLGAHYLVASVMGFLISVLNAYFWQSHFVFKEKEGGEKRVWWRVLLKTYMAYGFSGLILNNILLVFMIDVLNVSRFLQPVVNLIAHFGLILTKEELGTYIGPVLCMLITVPLNFITNKFWAYRQKDNKKAE